jgi:putative ABC transport system ATP-binding protein
MLSAENISKKYHLDGREVSVLKGVSIDIAEGEFLSIMGKSGSGKTTLLNILSTLVRADGGELRYLKNDLRQISEKQLNQIRKADFSVIFQFHYLLPYLTVIENTLLPFMSSFKPVSREVEQRALHCLERVGLADKHDRLPGNLSGGEQQRVAIARALIKSSRVLFADEPTGSLDKATGEQIMALLGELNEEGLTVVMVTHEPVYAALAERIVQLEDGRVVH